MNKYNSDRFLTIIICTFAVIFALVFKLMPTYYYHMGHHYLKKQDYVKARANFKNAYFFNRNDKDYRYYYVKSLLNLSPSEPIQKELFELASSSQQDSAQQAAITRVSEWRNAVLNNIGDNYIEQVPLDKGIIRWDIKKFPLKVVIVDNSEINVPSYYKNEILQAFAQWQVSTRLIKFELTNRIKDANIIVKIMPPPENVCEGNVCRYVVGFTTPNYKDSTLYDMTIVLYSTDPFGNYFSDKELYNTILHEIGHALGIMGHSYSSEDLMYMTSENDNSFYAPYRSSFQYLSTKDINTIELLYKLIPNITNTPLEEFNTKGLIYAPIILGTSSQISMRKLKEAQNYIKNAPNLAGGYIDLAIAYTELNKNRDALKALEKALELAKSDNEKFMVNYNLAVLNMNENNLEAALNYAKAAKQINNSEEVKELITNINHAKLANKKPFKGHMMSFDETPEK